MYLILYNWPTVWTNSMKGDCCFITYSWFFIKVTHRKQQWWGTEGARLGIAPQSKGLPSSRSPSTMHCTTPLMGYMASIKQNERVAPIRWQYGQHPGSKHEGGPDTRLQTMTAIIVSLATERFGTVEKSGNKGQYKNRRAEMIMQLRVSWITGRCDMDTCSVMNPGS